jgi:preprotein translocase subunit SecA
MLSKQIEKAQRKVEEQNFLIRKRVLEYDDVMNEQRRIVYEYRDQVLEGKDMGEAAREEIAAVIGRIVESYTPGDYVEDWDLAGLFVALEDIWPVGMSIQQVADDQLDRADLSQRLTQDAAALYDRREQELGEELMRALERYLLLQIIDQRWREHLYDMDYLREGIHLRGFAQIDPLVAYKNEAFDLFTDLMNTIWSDFARMVFHVEVEVEGTNGDEAAGQYTPGGSRTRGGTVSYSGGVGTAQPSALAAAAAGAPMAAGADGYDEDPEPMPAVQQRRVEEVEQIGRNDPCWCGSGKKFKRCHGT